MAFHSRYYERRAFDLPRSYLYYEHSAKVFIGDLVDLKQGEGRVSDYAREFQRLLSQAPRMRREDEIDAFIAGLPTTSARDVRRARPRDLTDAIYLAREAEREEDARNVDNCRKPYGDRRSYDHRRISDNRRTREENKPDKGGLHLDLCQSIIDELQHMMKIIDEDMTRSTTPSTPTTSTTDNAADPCEKNCAEAMLGEVDVAAKAEEPLQITKVDKAEEPHHSVKVDKVVKVDTDIHGSCVSRLRVPKVTRVSAERRHGIQPIVTPRLHPCRAQTKRPRRRAHTRRQRRLHPRRRMHCEHATPSLLRRAHRDALRLQHRRQILGRRRFNLEDKVDLNGGSNVMAKKGQKGHEQYPRYCSSVNSTRVVL